MIGLTHNTGSIMEKIIEKENQFYNPPEHFNDEDFDEKDFRNGWIHDRDARRYDHSDINEETDYDGSLTQYKNVKNLMDAKELSDPIDVFKEIEQTLKDSGDIHKYKDYLPKLRNNPAYKDFSEEKQQKLNYEKNVIKFRKDIHIYLKQINELLDIIKSKKDNVDDAQSMFELIKIIEDRAGISYPIYHFDDYLIKPNNIPKSIKDKNYKLFKEHLQRLENALQDQINELYFYNSSEHFANNFNIKQYKQLVLPIINEIISIISNLVYIISDI